MAVQIPDPGTGNGQTGDNEYVFRKKVKDNFSDQNNAASKLVGRFADRLTLGSDAFHNTFAFSDVASISDCNLATAGSIAFVNANTALNTPNVTLPEYSYWLLWTIKSYSSNLLQIAYGYNTANGEIFTRNQFNGAWKSWVSSAHQILTYQSTTASGANVVVGSNGNLLRSTSSERYKDILSPLELDDARYADAMALKPIVYRSTADADNPAYHFYSFSAEELGAYDPAFTLWRETETVTDADGNVTEQPLAERQAEGININALLAMSHAIAIKQGEIIKALEHRLDILETK